MSVHELIAHFLEENKYTETLKAFQNEHGRPIATDGIAESLEEIVQDRQKFKAVQPKIELHEKHELSDLLWEWTGTSQKEPTSVQGLDDLVVTGCYEATTKLLFVSTNKMTVDVIDIVAGRKISSHSQVIGRVVIKQIVTLPDQQVVFIGMDGKFHLFEYTRHDQHIELNSLSVIQGHRRLVIGAKSIEYREKIYLVSIGWDLSLKVFELRDRELTEVAETKLSAQGTCFDLVDYNGDLVVVVGKLENTMLDVFKVDLEAREIVLRYKISLNDAEFSPSGFTPMAVTIQTTTENVPLVAVGTSHEPYMRVILVSLQEYSTRTDGSTCRYQIIKNYNSMSPQDRYSQAQIKLDGPGLWIAGDDGTIRGFELTSGKTVVELKGHQAQIKAFFCADHLLVSCGTDRTVNIWRD